MFASTAWYLLDPVPQFSSAVAVAGCCFGPCVLGFLDLATKMEDRVDLVQGIRVNTVVYCFNGFAFQRTHVRNMNTFCKCRIAQCPARLSFRVPEEPVVTGDHNHQREDAFIQDLQLRSALIQRGLNQDTPPREIYDEERLR